MPPKKTQASRGRGPRKPAKKTTSSRANFDDSDSEDMNRGNQHLSSSQTLLGSHNTLKQLLAGPSAEPKAATITPPRKNGRASRSTIPLSPINSASTPISRLKHATAQLGISEGGGSPIHFDDIENESPPQKKRRSGRPRKNAAPISKSVKPAPAPRKPRKTPKIEEFPEEDDSYMEEATHHLLDLTEDTDVLQNNTRRSSYNNRGKRGSSIGNGFVAKPHSEVSERDYYKLLDSSMSEPNRMRQLLSWCFRKTVDTDRTEGDDGTGEAGNAEGIAKAIELELLNDLIDGSISTSWYSIDDDSDKERASVPGRTILLPNPSNESNKENIEIFKAKLQSLRAEKVELLKAYDASVQGVDGLRLNQSATPEELRAYVRENKLEKSVPESVLDESLLKQTQQNVMHAKTFVDKNLELNVDKLHHLSLRLRQGAALASRVGRDILEPEVANLVDKYRHRGGERKAPPTRELLRGIAALDAPKKPKRGAGNHHAR